MHNGVKQIASAQNYMYDDKIRCKRAFVNNKIDSSERIRILVAQDRVVDNLMSVAVKYETEAS